jgi:hypothetical protein
MSAAAMGHATSIKHFYASDKISITMTASRFVEGLVWMVDKDGIPLRYFSSASSQKLLGEMAAKLKVSLDRNRIRDYVITASQNFQDKTKKKTVRTNSCTSNLTGPREFGLTSSA